MATIQERNKSFRILFVYQGKRHSITLGKVKPDEDDLWDCLYLRKEEIEALLAYVKEHATALRSICTTRAGCNGSRTVNPAFACSVWVVRLGNVSYE